MKRTPVKVTETDTKREAVEPHYIITVANIPELIIHQEINELIRDVNLSQLPSILQDSQLQTYVLLGKNVIITVCSSLGKVKSSRPNTEMGLLSFKSLC